MSWFLLARHPSNSSHQIRLLLCIRFLSPVLPMSPDMLQSSRHQGSRTIVHLKVDAFRHRRLPPTHVSRGPVFVSNGGARGKEPSCQCKQHRRRRFYPWVGKISQRRSWQPTPVFLPGEFQWWRNLVGYSPRGRKESYATERAHTPSLSNNPIEE